MAEGTDQQQDTWSEGLSNFAEAARHSLTASRLLTAGAVALGAAATAYLWDDDRRNDLVKSGKKLSDDMLGWWGLATPRGTRGQGGTSGSDT